MSRLKLIGHRLLLVLVRPLARLVSPRAHRQRRLGSLWVGDPILTLAFNAQAERLNGHDADSLVFTTYFVTDEFTYDLSPLTAVPIFGKLVRYLCLIWAVGRYRRFHFFFNRGFLPQLERGRFNPDELHLLRALGKELYFWAYGGDVRTRNVTRELGQYQCCFECPAPGAICVCDDSVGSENYRLVREHATAVFSMGDMIHYTAGSRNDLYYWPVPVERDGGRRYRPCYPDSESTAALRVVHSPNQPAFKGTRFLEQAIDRLHNEQVAVELEIVRGASNEDALERYRQADVLFDQCLIGFHGYTALEAMALGKVVLCFLRHPRQYLLAPDECPIVQVTPESLAEVIRSLVNDRARARELGLAGRRYVERHHSLESFAGRLAAAIDAGGGRDRSSLRAEAR